MNEYFVLQSGNPAIVALRQNHHQVLHEIILVMFLSMPGPIAVTAWQI